ncbi:MAG: hypothetical protein QOE27_1727 [Solirubrobacteraceae bacterium]|nr:hypothetical protein [Solirubrobacteraceae bacterium]
MSNFTAETFQNEYLPADGDEVNAVVTVTASGGGSTRRGAEIVIVDTSLSMGVPSTKLAEAVRATTAAITCIRDGVAFGVISGSSDARVAYPPDGGLAVASQATRAAAYLAVRQLRADGGTAMGAWLRRAAELFGSAPPGTRHAILLTDGQNQHETAEQLGEALAAVEGRFQCDCRGVGTDWEVGELRRIADTLLGSVDIVADPRGLVDDFTALMEKAMGRATGDVSLRLWTPRGATVAFVRQVAPTLAELTHRSRPPGGLSVDYATGSWGEESRDYHVCIRVGTRDVGEEMLAGRVSLIEGDQVRGQALIKAIWTDDEQRSTQINREVAHYTGQAELAEAIQDGIEARRAGDGGTATLKLGRAVQLAARSGNDATMKLLARVVEIDDPVTGTVRLRGRVEEADEMTLDTRSTKTVRVGPG